MAENPADKRRGPRPRLDPSARRTDVHIMLPLDVLAALDRAADAEGMSRSAWVETLLREALGLGDGKREEP